MKRLDATMQWTIAKGIILAQLLIILFFAALWFVLFLLGLMS